MAKSKITKDHGSRVTIQPTFGHAFNMSFKIKGRVIWMIFGLLILLGTAATIVMRSMDKIDGNLNFFWFVGCALGLGLILGAPAQLMVNNEYEVDKQAYLTAVDQGNDDQFFTRFWA